MPNPEAPKSAGSAQPQSVPGVLSARVSLECPSPESLYQERLGTFEETLCFGLEVALEAPLGYGTLLTPMLLGSPGNPRRVVEAAFVYIVYRVYL